jgi:hypothetical protein
MKQKNIITALRLRTVQMNCFLRERIVCQNSLMHTRKIFRATGDFVVFREKDLLPDFIFSSALYDR